MKLFIIRSLYVLKKGGGVYITAYDFYTNIYQLKNTQLVQELVNATESRYLKKGDSVIRTGEIQNDIYFMEDGILRGYFLDVNGKEVTDCFGFRSGTPAIAFCQMELEVPSPLTIEMLEDGNFFCVPIHFVTELQKHYPEVMMLYNRLLIFALNEHWKLKQVLIQYSAIQRYQWFLKEYPGLIDRVSNKYIASFLGMTPVTLSRLRRAIREEQQLEKNT